ncbi:hypothetical protein [Amycolatopsis sp. TNS106]|uniref:hypothetical protein n=1 Tax=Amycolatopsis sp. TNS106 TaxID=2861750 RepID=UPI001C595FB0|nr:hypothetical protein [Amycolatopsis sp. TNS106]QXV57429.1 hypothetical protein CVV72_10800 [Amycolatopsis sp. TNS106]
MSSEEELEGLEDAVTDTMVGYLARRSLTFCLLAFLLLTLEFVVTVVAVIGALALPTPYQWLALAVLFAIVAARVIRIVINHRRRPKTPSRLSKVLLKIASLPMNALCVPALAGISLTFAVVTVGVATLVELVLWLYSLHPAHRELRHTVEFLKGNEPRTWEV